MKQQERQTPQEIFQKLKHELREEISYPERINILLGLTKKDADDLISDGHIDIYERLRDHLVKLILCRGIAPTLARLQFVLHPYTTGQAMRNEWAEEGLAQRRSPAIQRSKVQVRMGSVISGEDRQHMDIGRIIEGGKLWSEE